MNPIDLALEARLLTRRSIVGECWNWAGAVTSHGYGRMSYRNHIYRVHRLAAHLWLGLDLADSEVKVCHTCDNPPCFNPEHLYLGTQKTNVEDMVARGRAYPGPPKWDSCARGHALTPDNLVGAKRPHCRTCNNDWWRKRRKAVFAAAKASGLTCREYVAIHGYRLATAERILAQSTVRLCDEIDAQAGVER